MSRACRECGAWTDSDLCVFCAVERAESEAAEMGEQPTPTNVLLGPESP
jgi:recombinational DNA repair protein RecR